MQLHDLYPFRGQRKTRRRVGRGGGSGLGGTAGKGHKGQNARAGGGVRPGFEGGQMPLARRLPKHGFKNALFKTVYAVVNLDTLVKAFPDKTEISLEDIYARRLAPKGSLVKILSRGDISQAVNVEAFTFSKQAKDKICKAGGSVKELQKAAASE